MNRDRGEGREREKKTTIFDLLLDQSMHSLVVSYMYLDEGLNHNLGILRQYSNQLCYPKPGKTGWHF